MGLAEQQHTLARLYTDADFRERFLADPRGISADLGLAPGDAQRLIQLSSAQVRFFARSLYRKRLGEVRKLLPATAQDMGRRFEAIFREFAETGMPAGTKKHREGALAFARFLEPRVRRDGVFPAWLVDVIRYESAWLQARDPRCRCIVRWFRSPVGKVLRALEEGGEPSVPAWQRTLALWFRPHGRARLRHLVCSPPGFPHASR